MNIQLIDEFRRRTNASYDEARFYLEKYNYDLLEAIIAFERERTGYQNCRNTQPRSGNFGRSIMRGLQKLFDLRLVITDRNLKSFNIPVILPIVLFPIWHMLIPVALVMLFVGFRFSFQEMPDMNVNVESIVSKVKDKVKENTRSY